MLCPKCQGLTLLEVCDTFDAGVTIGWCCRRCNEGGIFDVTGHRQWFDDNGDEVEYIKGKKVLKK